MAAEVGCSQRFFFTSKTGPRRQIPKGSEKLKRAIKKDATSAESVYLDKLGSRADTVPRPRFVTKRGEKIQGNSKEGGGNGKRKENTGPKPNKERKNRRDKGRPTR